MSHLIPGEFLGPSPPKKISRKFSKTSKKGLTKIGPLFLQSGFSDTVFHDMCEFLSWILLWIFCPLFKGTEGPKKSTPKIHAKIHDKIQALRMKIHHDECSAEGQSWQKIMFVPFVGLCYRFCSPSASLSPCRSVSLSCSLPLSLSLCLYVSLSLPLSRDFLGTPDRKAQEDFWRPFELSDPRHRNHKSLAIANRNFLRWHVGRVKLPPKNF